MKNIVAILVAIALGYVFWPEKKVEVAEDEIDYSEEYNNEIKDIEVKPKVIAKKKNPVKKALPAKIVRPKIQKPKAIEAPIKASVKTKLDEYKTTKPPENIEFKINKDGFAIAFGDIFLGKVNNPQNLKVAKTKPKPVKLWDSPDIPYFIDKKIADKAVILNTIAIFNENTNLNFFLTDGGDEDGIVFTAGDEHCYSYLGKTGGFQPIYLSNQCREREIAHEIMHAIGFIHEHTRQIRDDYIKINWENIQEDFYRQFTLAPAEFSESTIAGLPFSYKTIMLYDPKSFAIDKTKNTIDSITSTKIFSSREILSQDDINRINSIY